ncbi:MAG: DUF72 domain-containing protein [Polyangiaceae bacterium]
MNSSSSISRLDVAPCVADSSGLFPRIEDLCASFVYVRLHGAERLYTSGYSDAQLRYWANRIRSWSRGRQVRTAQLAGDERRGDERARSVYVYFDNDAKVHAPFDAINLERLLSGKPTLPAPPELDLAAKRPVVVRGW